MNESFTVTSNSLVHGYLSLQAVRSVCGEYPPCQLPIVYTRVCAAIMWHDQWRGWLAEASSWRTFATSPFFSFFFFVRQIVQRRSKLPLEVVVEVLKMLRKFNNNNNNITGCGNELKKRSKAIISCEVGYLVLVNIKYCRVRDYATSDGQVQVSHP